MLTGYSAYRKNVYEFSKNKPVTFKWSQRAEVNVVNVKLTKTALIVYWSKTGNTEKVANVIKQGLEDAEVQVTMKKQAEAEKLHFN